ncbi:putative Cytochrome P450 [Seiridium unicorne]|uniref:Cytochrome P450 n=1 Tax=Seiridium unicorne TaxID=138068 RepID=A0ABR2UV91_9PEZI
MSSTVFAITFGGVAATFVFLWALLHMTQDKSEPPVVSTSIPFVSPLLGMVRWSMDFCSFMRKRHPTLPIYTLRIPGTRIYVINSLDLIPVVQRQWRTLIFAPIQVKAAKAAMGVSKDSIEILELDMVTESGFINGMVKATHPTISSGPALDAFNSKAFEVFDAALRGFDGRTTISMFEWINKQIMYATTDAVYGPANPMRDARNLEAWHKYHPAMMFLMLDILPQTLFFRTAVHGREYLVKSFAKYYKDASYKQGSAYIQHFTEHCNEQRIPEIDIPRLLLGTVFNNVVNTSPTAFWVIYHIFSDAVVEEECRNEVNQAVQDGPDGISTIDLSFVLNSCPILLSTYHEVFRYHAMANSFYQKRFVKQQGDSKSLTAIAFRGFGGCTTLCPGRHFATSEIPLLATMLLLRFNVQPADGMPWVLPSTANSSQAEAMEQPDKDINIKLVPRPEANGRTWRVAFSGQRS